MRRLHRMWLLVVLAAGSSALIGCETEPSHDARRGDVGDDGDDGDDDDCDDGECADPSTLPHIGHNEEPFTLCMDDADCNQEMQHFCYHQPGHIGVCQVPDADIWCDGEGDVNLQTVPPLDDWGPGMCVFTEWRDYLCCAFPGEFACE